jgi:uncharacterized repeat protein (TIGR02543 family)
VSAAGDGSGNIDVQPAQADYYYGDVVTLTAHSSPGSLFDHWSGAASGQDPSTSITIYGDTAVTATFTLEPYSIQVTKAGDGSGDVAVEPQKDHYVYGDSVTFTATPAHGSEFAGWSGAVDSSEISATTTIQGNALVTATFTLKRYVLQVDVGNGGSVLREPEQTTYAYGQQVTLSAVSDPGYVFVGWDGDLAGDDNPTTLVMDGDKQVAARFVRLHTFMVNADGRGDVRLTPDIETRMYIHGTQVTLEAVPDLGWHFAGWSGDLDGAENPTSITVEDDMSITARFVRRVYLPLVANP